MTIEGLPALGPFIPAISPRWVEPVHLAPMIKPFERALVEPVRAAISVCPRVGKTEVELHAIPWWLLHRPDLRIAYVSYSQRFAEKKSRRAREFARIAGVPLDADAASKSDWRTGVGEGGVWATSIEGSVTGEGFDIVIVDDPHKDRAAAESAAEREKVDEWFRDVLFTRLEPAGSVFVVHARWHPDDLIGRLERDGWPTVNLPAIGDDGQSIWPSRWPLERFREIEDTLGPYGWGSLYMGAPQPRGGQPFEGLEFFDALPKNFRAIATGVDLAYTAKTSADASVAVTVGVDETGFYVLDVVRQQVAAPAFKATLKRVQERFPTTRFHAYIGGTERGVIDLLAIDGVQILAEPAVTDKFIRAQPCSAAWCARRIFVPRSIAALRPNGEETSSRDHETRPPWLDAFSTELASFTGIKDRRDDQIDALVAAFDALKHLSGKRKPRDRTGGSSAFITDPYGGVHSVAGSRFGAGRGFG